MNEAMHKYWFSPLLPTPQIRKGWRIEPYLEPKDPLQRARRQLVNVLDGLWWLRAQQAVAEEAVRMTQVVEEGERMPRDESYVPPENACPLCRKRGKTWQGGDPECAFPDGGGFNPNNWNCATAIELRDIIERMGWRQYNCDQSSGTIPIPECLDDEIEGLASSNYSALFVWLEWYKDRGRTEGAYLAQQVEPPIPLPLRVAELLIEHYEGTAKEGQYMTQKGDYGYRVGPLYVDTDFKPYRDLFRVESDGSEHLVATLDIEKIADDKLRELVCPINKALEDARRSETADNSSGPFTREELFRALGDLHAYDDGATDSGVHDEALKARVFKQLREVGERDTKEFRKLMAAYAKKYYLSDDAIERGYSLEDVIGFEEWVAFNYYSG